MGQGGTGMVGQDFTWEGFNVRVERKRGIQTSPLTGKEGCYCGSGLVVVKR